MTRIRALLVLFLAVVVLAAPAYAAPDRYVLVTLLHTNDMHGSVMPEGGKGGLAKIATLVRQVRADMPNVVLLDAGDIIHGTFEEYLSGGRAIISSMNAAGYDVATLGNHEFDFGNGATEGMIASAAFPFTSANIKDRATGETWNGMQPYIIRLADGVKIAVFGLTTVEAAGLQWPSRISQLEFKDPIETARALVPELRKQADVVVALSHLGYRMDQTLASTVPGIDFIIGGHSHTVLDKWTWVGDTMITHAGGLASYLGRIDFIVKLSDAGSSIAAVNGKNGLVWSRLERRPLNKTYPEGPFIAVTSDVADDPLVVAAYTPYRINARQVLDQVIGESPEGVMLFESGESPAGNLVADAIRQAMGSDAAVVDPASVQGAIVPGPITVESAFRMIGGYTRQNLVKVEMTGSTLTRVLNTYLTQKKSPPLVVSGMTVTYASGKDGKPQIRSITVGGAPLEQAGLYTVASQAYVVMDWMKAQAGIRVVADPNITTREAIVDYIRTQRTINYKLEKRVRRL